MLHLVLLLLSMLWTGFVIMNLWNWFIVPLGVISITLFHAIGIDMLISLMTPSFVPKDIIDTIKGKHDYADSTIRYVTIITLSTLCFIVGAAMHALM